MEFGQPGTKCGRCGVESKDDGRLPTMTFNWLEGEPTICDACFARQLGIEATWKDDVRVTFKDQI